MASKFIRGSLPEISNMENSSNLFKTQPQKRFGLSASSPNSVWLIFARRIKLSLIPLEIVNGLENPRKYAQIQTIFSFHANFI
jgi:hypothetical protein